jgi:hypothetical protein
MVLRAYGGRRGGLDRGTEPTRRGNDIACPLLCGYAGTLAVLLYEHWPTLTHKLLRQMAGSRNGVGGWRVPPWLAREALREAPQQFWDHSPWVTEQVFRVKPCGWSGLRSTRAIARVARPNRNPRNAIAEAARRRRKHGPQRMRPIGAHVADWSPAFCIV